MEQQKLTFNRKVNSEIIIGNEILKDVVAKILRMRIAKNAVVITNETVAKWYLQPLIAELNTRGIHATEVIIPDGEKYKNIETVTNVISQIAELCIERNSPIISLGGGVVGDIGGFVASIYKRGLPHIYLPTSLLAMVDASIGGKTGINIQAAKNMIGTFYQPTLVAIDLSFLKTLPLSQMSYGIVEALKHGAIADSAYYNFIAKNIDAIKAKQASLLQRLVRRSIHIKKNIVLSDELDMGMRAILNFGHTFGHAFETAGGYMRLHHGEAVGLGMLAALKVAAKLGELKEDYSESLTNILIEFNLPTSIPKELDKNKILNIISNDKKINNGEHTLILPLKLGEVRQFKIDKKKFGNIISML